MASTGLFNSPGSSQNANAGSEKSQQEIFKSLKEVCVPLLGNSRLTSENIPRVWRLLSELWSRLKALSGPQPTLSPATIEYVFFPLSHILQRNLHTSIPDVIMEKLMDVFALLVEQWWWTCPVEAWEQVLMLSASIFGGVDISSDKGKRKLRDEDTMRATANCLWSVLRKRDKHDASQAHTLSNAEERFKEFQARSQGPNLVPLVGQMLPVLLDAANSANRELQITSLRVIHTIMVYYLPDGIMPSILPGVVSGCTNVALGRKEGKGWSNGDIVDLALKIMQEIIVRAVGDEVCQAEGAIRTVSDLEDLANGSEPDASRAIPTSSPYFIPRTSLWLVASASQLHNALNTISPLRSHPNPIAQSALSRFAYTVASNTSKTIPDTQPLLISMLLSLSSSAYPDVADLSSGYLLKLLAPPSAARFTLLQVLIQITQESLAALPQVLPSRNDSKIEHLARQVSAVCRLAKDLHVVSEGLGKLLGPSGGIEKWGWTLLSSIEFAVPPLFVSTVQPIQGLLEGGAENEATHPFPTVQMKYITSLETRETLDSMLRVLGAAGGPECLFSVEWFVEVAVRGRGTREVAALWCATKLLEGVGDVSLDAAQSHQHLPHKRVEKVARWTAKVIAELWDQEEGEEELVAGNGSAAVDGAENDRHLPLEYVKGLDPLITRFDVRGDRKPSETSQKSQRTLHSVLCLHMLSVTSAILQVKFARLLLYTLYPVLRSIVSEDAYLSSTALAALHLITSSTSYASPSNLLLANFDYALDSVARRLDRRHLDPEATKILVILVRLVGKDVVSRAGDVVEACFDRLDEFHGYNALVEGLVEVLVEVVRVVEVDSDEVKSSPVKESSSDEPLESLDAFLQWYKHRNDKEETYEEDYGPAPRAAWAEKGKEKESEEEAPPSSNPEGEDHDPPLTPTQALTQQIVERSTYFLTHPSALIRARILILLEAAGPTLSESVLLPSIHSAWPYVLNRLADPEPFVVSAAASLIASLAEHVGDFMATRIWNDVWPRFRRILSKLEAADAQSALTRRDRAGAVGTESAYTLSHRLYVSLLRTMCAVVKGIPLRHDILWEVLILFRRFLHSRAHGELQQHARELYCALRKDNEDAVWLALSATSGNDITGLYDGDFLSVSFLMERKWDLEINAKMIIGVH